nr:organomercurial lyase [Cryobacterium sp. TMS1-13-1]
MLIVPTILGTSAVIESRYRTGTPVRVTVDSSGVRSVEPTTAVVSLVAPDDMSSVRSSFCDQVHFFALLEETEPWIAGHEGGPTISVAEAFALGASMAERMLAETAANRSSDDPSHSCC